MKGLFLFGLICIFISIVGYFCTIGFVLGFFDADKDDD